MNAKFVLFSKKYVKGYRLKLYFSLKSKDHKLNFLDIWLDSPKQFNAKTQLVVDHPLNLLYNEQLVKAKDCIQKALVQVNKYPEGQRSADLFLSILNKLYYDLKIEASNGLFKYLQGLEYRCTFEKRFGSAKAYKQATLQFEKYLPADATFESLDFTDLERISKQMVADGRTVNTVAVYFRQLRAAYNYAIKEKVISQDCYPFKNFKIKTVSTKKRALNKDFLKLVYNYKPENAQEQFALDCFKLSFNLIGINMADLFYLKKSVLNTRVIEYLRTKTKTPYRFEANNEAIAILSRIAEESKTDYIFSFISSKKKDDQNFKAKVRYIKKANTWLKKIGEKLNLPFPLTTYVARHSWANMAVKNNADVRTIQKSLGHKSITTTEIYLKEVEETEVNKLNNSILDDLLS